MKMRLSHFTLLSILCFSVSTFAKQHSYAPGSGDLYLEAENRGEMHPMPMNLNDFTQGEIDLSFLMKGKPAGSDGFVVVKDGHYYTENGDRLKLWGVNLTAGACFPEKEDAATTAEFYARIGINAVRLHFLDSAWGEDSSLFSDAQTNTQEFNPEMLDRLDYFIAELKKQGVYSNINLNVGRKFRKDDGVPYWDYIGRGKCVSLFDDRVVELEKDYARKLLTHVNPYTGNSYVNEPAVAVVELVNENSLVEAWNGKRLRGKNTKKDSSNWDDIHPYYAKILTEKYNQWLQATLDQKSIDKIRTEAGVSGEELIPRLDPDEFDAASKFRFRTEAEFIIWTEKKFHTEFYDFLRNELKFKAIVLGNSDHNHAAFRMAQLSILSELSGTDGHAYWQHPKYKRNAAQGEPKFLIANSPMVNEPLNNILVDLSGGAVVGKPYSVSETNHPYPSDFACEGFGLMSAYADLQDWDAVYFYTMEHSAPGHWDKSTTYKYFDLYGCPVRIATFAMGAIMFRRSDVEPANNTILRSYTHEQVLEGVRGDSFQEEPFFSPGFSNSIPLVHQTRIDSFDQSAGRYPSMDLSSPIVSDTGEIQWHYGDNRGRVIIDSDKSQGLIGFIKEGKEQCENLSVNLDNPFAAVQVVSLDDSSISESGNLLVSMTSRMGLTGMKWTEDRKSLIEFGEKPAVVEAVSGTIVLCGLKTFKRAEVSFLDGSGLVVKQLTFKGGNQLDILVGEIPSVWMTVKIDR